MSGNPSKIPSLHFPSTPFSPEDLSPRSEEFREAPSLPFSIFPNPKTAPQLANLPNRTIPSQELKNPLLARQIDYEIQVRKQEQELIALSNIQQKLSEKLKIALNELNTVKDVPTLMKDKDEQIRKLEISLELAKEQIRKEQYNTKNVSAQEIFKVNRPVRVWKVQDEVKELQELKEKVIKGEFF